MGIIQAIGYDQANPLYQFRKAVCQGIQSGL